MNDLDLMQMFMGVIPTELKPSQELLCLESIADAIAYGNDEDLDDDTDACERVSNHMYDEDYDLACDYINQVFYKMEDLLRFVINA